MPQDQWRPRMLVVRAGAVSRIAFGYSRMGLGASVHLQHRTFPWLPSRLSSDCGTGGKLCLVDVNNLVESTDGEHIPNGEGKGAEGEPDIGVPQFPCCEQDSSQADAAYVGESCKVQDQCPDSGTHGVVQGLLEFVGVGAVDSP